MKSNIRKIVLLPLVAFASFLGFSVSADTFIEPESSILNSGKWVKIRVEADGVYQLTADELKNLGFDNPEAVNVYGYNPTLLLTHSFNVIPVDLSQIPSMYENGKLVFYGKSNIDFEPEIWRYEKYKASVNQTEADFPTHAQFEHKRHAFSRGATYFLSDVEPERLQPESIAVSEASESPALTHTAIIHHEEDVNHFGVGGLIFVGDVLKSESSTVSYPFELRKVANGGNARLIYQGLDSYGGKKAPLITSFSEEIRYQAPEGAQMPIVATSATHQVVGLYRRYQQILVPEIADPVTYNVTFSVNPEFTSFKEAAIDYWTLLYSRRNDLSNESQLMMCFDYKSFHSGNQFAVVNHDDETADWHFWDVTAPLAVKECEMTADDDGRLIGQIAETPSEFAASYVVAFDLNSELLTPEVVEVVANQNLHSMQTPDAVILTSAVLTDVAEELADVHRRLQGLEIEIVDQQKVFNEYGSGNISPESVRRFLAHLNRKRPGKLKALIILGQPVVDNAKEITPSGSGVITAQNECLDDDTYEVRSLYSDSFYGRFSNPQTSGNWGVRHPFYQVHGNAMDIAIGRIPFSSISDIRAYINKVEEYITQPPHAPVPGTVMVASDFEGSPGAPMHYADAEAAARPLADRFGKELTVIRPAANFYSLYNFTEARKVMFSAFSQGVSLMLYFGHGRPDEFGATKGDYLMPLALAESYNSPGRYPFAFIGSCNVARSDVNPSNVTNALLKNKRGGFIGLVASTREVFQQENSVLGLQFVKEYDAANGYDYWGDVYKRAHSRAVNAAATNRRTMINHLCYTYVGDPLLPIYKADRKISIHKVNDDNKTLYIGGSNRIEGCVMIDDSQVDPSFNGTVVLNIYDVPSVRRNLVAQGTTSNAEYMAEIIDDFTVIKQVIGFVKNGRFSVDFNAPFPMTSGTQRIQAYVYNDSETVRGLGYIDGLTSTSDHDRNPLDSKGELKINYLRSDIASFDRCATEEPLIEAEIYAPNGLSTNGLLRSSLRFSMDGLGRPDVMNYVNYIGDDIYRLTYATGRLSGGRHTIELLVKDDCGNEDYCELEFAVNNASEVEISAESDASGEITVDCNLTTDAETRVIVETLDGTLVKDLKTQTLPVTLSGIPSGVYRVYTQHQGENFQGSSAKTVVIVD